MIRPLGAMENDLGHRGGILIGKSYRTWACWDSSIPSRPGPGTRGDSSHCGGWYDVSDFIEISCLWEKHGISGIPWTCLGRVII